MLVWKRIAFMFFGAVSISACTEPVGESTVGPGYDLTEPHVQFFHTLRQLCGNAYAGKRVVARTDDHELLKGDEALVVHFRTCNDKQLLVPFHIEQPKTNSWDRSRTWVYTLFDDHLSLSHDHRLESGEPAPGTGYGGLTVSSGSHKQQLFVFSERTGDKGEILGWRVEIVPGERYSYGTMSDGDWTWRVDFDLTKSIAIPPTPWGHN